MPTNDMEHLPNEAKLWIYAFRGPLDADARGLIEVRLNAFMEDWNTHGSRVEGAWGFLEDRFVVVAGHNAEGISGCSTDTSVENFKWLKEKHDLDGFDRTLVFYRDADGAVAAISRPDFQLKVDSGTVAADTIVFDTMLTTVGDLRAGRFETTFAECWHAKLFKRRSLADGASTE